MPQSDENFQRMSPIQLVKPSGRVIPYGSGANTETARASALQSAITAAASGDAIRVLAGNIDLGAAQFGKAGVRFLIDPRLRIQTTDIDGIWNNLGAVDYPYVYNLGPGLRRWFNSLGMTARSAAGQGMGGVDVLIIGHSRSEFGYGSLAPTDTAGTGTISYESYLCEKWSHFLKVWLQDYYNPSGVQGGMGYVPNIVGSQTATPDSRHLFTWVGTWGASLVNYPSRSGRILISTDGDAAYYRMQGHTPTTAVPCRFNVTAFDVCANQHSGGGTFTYDVGNGSVPTTGAGYVTGTQSTNGSTVNGNAYGPFGAGAGGDILRTADNYFKITAPTGGGELRWDGVIFYDNDRGCGVRVHNIADWGRSLNGQADDTKWPAVYQFFTGLPTDGEIGAKHCKLVICDHIGQDAINMANDDDYLPIFKANALAMISGFTTKNSKPCFLWVIPSMPESTSDITCLSYYKLIDTIYQIADETDHVAIINLDQRFRYARTGGAYSYDSIGGFTESDQKHDSCIGHRMTAEEIFKVLI